MHRPATNMHIPPPTCTCRHSDTEQHGICVGVLEHCVAALQMATVPALPALYAHVRPHPTQAASVYCTGGPV